MRTIHEDALRDAYSSLAAGDVAGATRKIENVLQSEPEEWMLHPSIQARIDDRFTNLDTVTSLLIDRVAALEREETTPRDWGHALAAAEERLTRRLSAVEERVGITRPWMGITPQAAAQPAGAPPGVVPPHVAQNLDRLLAWTTPTTWRIDGVEHVRMTAMLLHLNSLVQLARNGEDVPEP